VIVSTAASVSDALVAAYEELRREFLGSTHGPTRGLGLALLLDRGMPDWMEACARFVNTAVRTEPQPGRFRFGELPRRSAPQTGPSLQSVYSTTTNADGRFRQGRYNFDRR
jgi:hypothetical protein